jgi:hypothetical protein
MLDNLLLDDSEEYVYDGEYITYLSEVDVTVNGLECQITADVLTAGKGFEVQKLEAIVWDEMDDKAIVLPNILLDSFPQVGLEPSKYTWRAMFIEKAIQIAEDKNDWEEIPDNYVED